MQSSAYLQTKQDLNGAPSPGPFTEPRFVYGSGRNQACDEVVYWTGRYTLRPKDWEHSTTRIFELSLALAMSCWAHQSHELCLIPQAGGGVVVEGLPPHCTMSAIN